MTWIYTVPLYTLAVLASLTAGCIVDTRDEEPPAGVATSGVSSPGEYGLASYYARALNGKRTASGQKFNNDAMLAAHPSLPLGTLVRVTNLTNQRFVDVRIVDRGPAAGPRAKGVVIDISRAAAETLGFLRSGKTRVHVTPLP